MSAVLGQRPITAERFREAMAALAAPVTVVTYRDALGCSRGLTMSAVASLSLDPPLLLICLDRDSSCHDSLVAADAFCVNLLGPGSAGLARQFAGRPEQRFDGVAVDDGGWAPALADAGLRIQCVPYGVRDGGDHTILIGRVTETGGDARTGLVWHRRGFAEVVPGTCR